MTRPRRSLALLATAALLLSPLAGAAAAHEERDTVEPAPAAHPEPRDTGPSVVVCKPDSASRIATLPAPVRARNEALLARGCQFEHLQAAVDWIERNGVRGTRVLVLPGVYREEPSLRAHREFGGAPVGREDLAEQCKAIAPVTEGSGGDVPALTYEQQRLCPHKDNLVAVLGDVTPTDTNLRCDSALCDLQVEGTGASPRDVVLDGDFRVLNGLKGDRADGLYLKRLSAQQFEFNAVYVLETAGATFDEVDASFNHEYGFLSFLSYTRYENCSGQANGDSTVYPGASPNVNEDRGLIPLQRDTMTFSTEVRGCRSHHNGLGYSGTTGNSIWAHHNEFDHNSTGLATDSLFAGHPGTPQNHALWEDNLFHSNNENYYSRYAVTGQCAKPIPERDYGDGAVCPATPQPVGTGILIAGGNYNWATSNRIYDNWRQGTFQFSVPAEVREGEPVPEAHFRPRCGEDGTETCPFEETSHWNTYSGNRLAENPLNGLVQPNGVDFAWDVEGQGNCWDSSGDDANTSAAGPVTYGPVETTDPPSPGVPFPSCEQRDTTFTGSTVLLSASCITYDAETDPHPPGCSFMDDPAPPADRAPAGPVLQRVAGADRVATAIAASREGFPSAARAVTLARADAYPDALAGAPLAARRGGPLLLTAARGLDPRVADEVRRLRATSVVLLGGTTALSPQVEADLRALGVTDVTRVSGADRYATAAAVARSLPSTNAFLVKGNAPNGEGWVDALSLSPVAALMGRPILLTAPTSLPAPTAAALRGGEYDAVDVVGGDAAVSKEVAAEVDALLPEVERIAGADRFATSLEVAKWAVRAGADASELWLTTARDWPDAVAAGSAIAVDEGILLLVDRQLEGSALQTWLDEVNPVSDSDSASVSDVLERVRVLGGTAAVPASVDEALTTTYAATQGDARGDSSSGSTLWHGLARRGAATGAPAGTASVERTRVGSTRAWLALDGLTPGASYTGRLVTGTCADPGADLDLPGTTEVALQATADAGGTAVADDTVFETTATAPGAVLVRDAAGAVAACAALR